VEVPGGAGKRPRRYVYGRTRAEVQKKVDQARRAIESGIPVPDERLTVGKFLDWWITQHVPTKVRTRTLPTYEQKVRHVTRLLGRVRLTRLTPAQVEAACNQLLKEGHNEGGVMAIKRVFNIAMNKALKEGYVARNVVALADGLKVEDREKDPFSVDEVQAIRAEMEGDRLMPLFFVALALGLREGEAFGVRWSDVDLDRGLLHVRQQVQPKRGGGFEFVEPKTKASKSTLELTKGQIQMLRRHRRDLAEERLAAGSEWDDYDLVFPSERGTRLVPPT
jgi:integrase